MELASNCYECASFGNIRDGKSIYGLCNRVGDCCGSSYIVAKEQTRCIFGNADRKLSLEEIKLRDENELEHHESFQRFLEHASEIVESGPKWKRNILGRAAQ